jgi:hypothetical protein
MFVMEPEFVDANNINCLEKASLLFLVKGFRRKKIVPEGENQVL